jgi:hypothetical protein
MHYQLELRLAALMDRLGLDDKGLAAELHLTPIQVQRLRTDQWSTIKRADLQTLLCWARRHEEEILSVQPSPVWRTLQNAEVVVFRGRDAENNPLPSDSRAEGELIEALKSAGCKIRPRSLEVGADPSEVTSAMRDTNCVFIGSPKYNVATEIALASMCQIQPSVASDENRRKAPFCFVWDGSVPTSAFALPKTSQEKLGVYLFTSSGSTARTRHHVPIDWRTARDYARWTGKGRDAGILVACNRPLGTEVDVTTIVLAGYSGFATFDMAVDFARNGLRIESREVCPGKPVFRVLSAPFRKTSRHGDSRRRLSKGRRWFSPPWSQLKELSARRS